MKTGFIRVLIVVQALTAAALIASMAMLGMLPVTYFTAISLFLVLMVILDAILEKKALKYHRIHKRPRVIIGAVLAVIMSAGSAFAAYQIIQGDYTIGSVTGQNSDKVVYSVIVRKDSSYLKLNDLEHKALSFEKEDSNTKNVLNALSKEVGVNSFPDGNSVLLADDLMKKKTQAVLINESYRSTIEDNQEDFTKSTRILWQYSIDKKAMEKTNADVDNDTFSIFVSGVDSRGGVDETSRSDANMVITVCPKTHQVLLTSIPRDYYVKIAGTNGAKDKLTHTGVLGTDCTVRTIEKMLDMHIDYYARINFAGVKNLVDALGGIKIYSDRELNLGDGEVSNTIVHIAKGTSTVNGTQALRFARERHSYEDGDSHRARNQQEVVAAVINKMSSPAVLKHYNKVLNAVQDCFRTNMDDRDIKKIVRLQLSSGKKWDIHRYELTGSGKTMTGGFMMPNANLYYMIPNEKSINRAKAYIRKMENGKKIEMK